MIALLLTFTFCTCIYSAQARFITTEVWSGSTFFNNFDFFTAADPTHGYVYFANEQQAYDWGLIQAKNPVYIGADHSSISSGPGRAAVRITSKKSWSVWPGSPELLFVIDLEHMPTGCGTWPAWWFVGPDWPSSGEIDVIEGVNQQTTDALTLHTTSGCKMNPGQGGFSPGKWTTTNCDVSAPGQPANSGCSIEGAPNSYGAPFNAQKGGVYAASWGHDSIEVWYFPRNRIPGDLQQGSNQANPQNWGLPVARFDLGGNCPVEHFKNLSMVFDLTFCGDWAGAAFEQNCPNKGTCQDFVKNHPADFAEAFWQVNFVKMMREDK